MCMRSDVHGVVFRTLGIFFKEVSVVFAEEDHEDKSDSSSEGN